MGCHHERLVCRCGNVLQQCRCMAPKVDRVKPGLCLCANPKTPQPPAGLPANGSPTP